MVWRDSNICVISTSEDFQTHGGTICKMRLATSFLLFLSMTYGAGEGALRWRMIGPFRGGRTVAAAGIADQPNVFIVAVNNGGVWKTTDAGRVWTPIFDDQPTGSIGALAIAPSDPNIIYVGSGEGLQRPDLSVGDGMYKSNDGGETWRQIGLRDGQQISAMTVDPRDPQRVFVAVLGHPYGPNPERGVYLTENGGDTWKKVLGPDENTGATDVEFDPKNPNIVYAVLWQARQGPWENAQFSGPNSGLFKSMDGGKTWKPQSKGLPAFSDGLGRIGIGIAPGNPKRIYALVEARTCGMFRSDDAGDSWQRVNGEARVCGRGSDFAGVRVDPKNPDIVYSANTSTYKSTDGGKTFHAWKGAPGGDDYHTVWINPNNPRIILLAADQGATITLNGGDTWSSWYNQPTAQFYHVSTDNRFPYWVYGGQQESGSAGVASRGDNGHITFRDWRTVGVEEYGYVAPDPLNPNFIYGGKLTRFDMRTGDVQQVGPTVLRGANHRFLRTAPVLFSTVDPHILYLGANVLFKTSNGGNSWDIISPDLSREKYDVPPSVGIYIDEAKRQTTRRGVIYTVAPSYKDVNVIWAGTDDGLIHVTRDGGKNWANVTPPEITPWSKISLMDASHFDTDTAYAAVNRIRCDDMKPHIYRTHDGGKTWKEIVKGLPDDPINVVREDPVRKGLLFAGSERAAYYSQDDGENWVSLRLNMPSISIRDLVVHDTDLVVGTHGRGFWILDDMTPLRQTVQGQVVLYKPRVTYRVRRNQNTDTPLPPEEPAGKNPPDGAIIYYTVRPDASEPITLEILDSAGALVRKYASNDAPPYKMEDLDRELAVPLYWVRPFAPLSGKAGMHRFIWDLRYAPPESLRRDFPISAILGDTPRYPLGAFVMPGEYTVRLKANGQTVTQSFTVKMDPRVPTPAEGLQQQFTLASKLANMIHTNFTALQEVKAARAKSPGAELDQKLAALEGGGGGGRRGPRGGGGEATLSGLNGDLTSVFELIESSDSTPTTQAAAAVAELERSHNALLARWQELKK